MIAATAPVFVLAEAADVDPAAAQATELLCAGLARLPGWLVPERAPDLLNGLVRLLYGFDAGTGQAGMSSLVDRTTFLREIRRLADGVVEPVLADGVVRVVDRPADPVRLAPYLRRVWPDAAVVVVSALDRLAAAVTEAAPDVWLQPADIDVDPAGVLCTVAAAAGAGVQPSGAAVRAARGRSWRRPRESRPQLPPTDFIPTASPLADHLVIVLGAARSGTTWLHRLLTAHPMVGGTETGETWLFGDVMALWNSPARDVVGDGPLLAAIRRFCDALLLAMRDRVAPGAAYVCEKTPESVWRLPLLTRLYPDARYLHVVRDGRDVALSMSRIDGGTVRLADAAASWVSAERAVRTAAPRLTHRLEVRYERMLADPVEVAESVWHWLGLPVDGAARTAARRRSQQRVTPLPPTGEIGQQKWRDLPLPEQQEVEAVAGDLLRELGYPPHEVPPATPHPPPAHDSAGTPGEQNPVAE
ncbi:MAG TPA: sulfotransferase [Mycobacteriales bacterium]|nr:sulfotransferase [Mycobacteriales bacterium]